MQTRHFEELKDKRLLDRSNSILNRLFANSIYSIRQLAQNDSEVKAMYRFLQNDNVSETDIVRNMSANCNACVSGRSVLCIQDTSEINLFNHRNRIKRDTGIGLTNASPQSGLGFFIHPSFIIDSETLIPYGFSDVKIWNRPIDLALKGKSHKQNSTPKEEKESYKWIESSQNSKKVLEKAKEVIIIQDREGDIYDQFCLIPDRKTHLLIRAKTNRVLAEGQRLFAQLSSQDPKGIYPIEIDGDKRRNTVTRTAKIEVRFCPITIKSNQYTDKNLPESDSLYAIEAKEITPNVENPIHWRFAYHKAG
ncbi:MAG TPA: IS4 family transposase [Bacteroidia bacterium]|nr:IS4 family transposase [Bacteroidia bacterium]